MIQKRNVLPYNVMMQVLGEELVERTIDEITDRILYNQRLEWEKRYWWDFIIKVADPAEKSFVKVMTMLFNGMKLDVLRRMRSGKGVVLKQDSRQIEHWMFGQREWRQRFQNHEQDLIEGIAITNGNRVLDELPVIGVGFDVTNPAVAALLRERSIRFAKEVVDTTERQIRSRLAAGIEKGESMTELRNRIAQYFEGDSIRNRTEMIARSETIWASNAGANHSYIQSGVVESREWLIADDERLCDFCRTMYKDFGHRKGIALDQTFAGLGQEVKATPVGGHEGPVPGPMTVTYEDVNWPPLHPRCRCTTVPVVKPLDFSTPPGCEKYGVNIGRGAVPVARRNTFSGVHGFLPDCKGFLSVVTKDAISCLTSKDKKRVLRAINTYKPATAKVQRLAIENEKKLASSVKAAGHLPDNDPFDVIVGDVKKPKHLIEVKTIIRGTNDKITMHKDSLQRKLDYASKYKKARVHTIVFDERVKKMYRKEGVGSFRLGNMEETNLKDLEKILK